MVRTAFYFCIGLFSVLLLSTAGFAQEVELRLARLGLQTSTTSAVCQAPNTSAFSPFSSANQYSQCAGFFGTPTPERFNFSEKHEAFSLQHIRNVSSLVHQGGSRLFQASNTIPLVSNALSAGIEMVYRDPFLSINSTPSPTTQLGTQLVLRGSMKTMTYRAEYGYAGKNTGKVLSLAPNGRVGGKFLWEWKLPFVTPKVELSRFANNVEHDPTRDQTTSTRQKYSLDWTIPDWPSLTLTYGREQKDIFSRSGGSRSDATLMERVMTKIAFEHSIGKGEWSSGYSTFQNDIHDQGTLEELRSTLKGTLHLFKPVDISPSIGFTKKTNAKLGFSQERLFANLGTAIRLSTEQTIQPSFEWTRIGNRGQASISDTLFSKLQYSYYPSDNGYHMSIIGQYVLKQSSQQITNSQAYDMSLFIRKDLHDLLGLPHQQQFISLKLTHNQQINTLSSRTQPNGSAAMLLFSIIP